VSEGGRSPELDYHISYYGIRSGRIPGLTHLLRQGTIVAPLKGQKR